MAPGGKNNITFRFTNGTNDNAGNDEQNAIREAFRIWSDYSQIIFTEVVGSADINIAWAVGDHGDGNPFDGPGGVLAHAFFPPPNGGPFAGNVHFDDDETWTMNERADWQQPIDLVTVAAHEIGHALGLAHSNVNCALMNAFYAGSHRYLAQDDIDGIRSIYGRVSAIGSLNNGVCTNSTYLFRNVPTGAVVNWVSSDPTIATAATININQAIVTRTGNANGTIRLTGTMNLPCGANVAEWVDIPVGGDAVGYYTINTSTTQNNLVNGSGSFITAQRGQNVYVHFQLTTNNLSSIVWSYDNVTSSGNPFTAWFTAPLTGYTNLYKTVYLNATSPCGLIQNYYPFTIMSLGWTYAMVASPNPTTGNINLAITTVADTATNVKIAAVTTATVLDNSTKIYLYDFNTSSLVKQWNFSENKILNYNLNIAGIKQGVYILKMQRDNKITNTKVIVQ